MIFREALLSDIPGMQVVRNQVKENALSNPALVTDADYEHYLQERGRGWVCEHEGRIIGFAIADLKDHNIWALFVMPGFDKRGIGRKLQEAMLEWYFSQTSEPVWLSTAPGTRAESFYRNSGWEEIGIHGRGEIKFLMSLKKWREQRPV